MRGIQPELQVGIVLDMWGHDPASASPEDIAAAERGWSGGQTHFIDPLLRGHYPVAVVDKIGADMPQVKDGDMALIAQKMPNRFHDRPRKLRAAQAPARLSGGEVDVMSAMDRWCRRLVRTLRSGPDLKRGDLSR